MKKLALLVVLATFSWSIDFSQMSTDELMKLRGTLSPSERPAFRTEMKKRMQTMSPEQKQQIMQNRGKGIKGQGQKYRMKKSMGNKEQKGMQNSPAYADYDLNHDNKITQKEFYNAQAARMKQKANEGKMMKNASKTPTFESIDTDHNGIISQTEFSTHQISRMNSMRGKGI